MASIAKRCRHRGAERETCGCTYYIRRKVAGKDTYTPAGTDKAAAERALLRSELAAEESVSAALDAWLDAKDREPGARPGSLASYRNRAKHVRRYFGDAPVRGIRPEHLSQFAAALLAGGLAPASARSVYAALTAALRHAVRRGVLPAVPVPPDGPGIPTPASREHALTLVEVEEVIERLRAPWNAVAELILLTGLRWGEAVAVEPGDIDGHVLRVQRTRNDAGGVNAPKTKAGKRVVPLSARARELLDDLPLPVGGDYRRAREALVAAMGDLHRPGMGWHTLRNAHASLLEAAGVALRDQAARMGHGVNYAQTLSYGLASQAGSAEPLDAARRHASPEPRPPVEDELQARRARRSSQEA